MIRTSRFLLKPLTTSDVTSQYVQWLHDDMAQRYITAAAVHQDIETVSAFVRERENRDDVLFLAIFVASTGEHIGNIKFEPVSTATRTATMGILLGERNWRSRGVAAEVLEACAHWLYANRSVVHIRLGVHRDNAAAIRAYEKVGFRLIGQQSSSNPHGLQMQYDYNYRSRLAVGTVQFGMNYGVANMSGQVSHTDAAMILERAREAGINTLDTAAAYGDSELRLGQIGVGDWRVVSKLSSLSDSCEDVARWVETSVRESLERLAIPKLYGLLLHRPENLLAKHGAELYAAMQNLKAQGLITKIGVSVYDPSELESLFPAFELDLVQAPYNVVDRRLATSGWLKRLKDSGVEVHTRSVFLQGLLLQQTNQRPTRFARWQTLWNSWDKWLEETKLTPLQACLAFALSNQDIDRVLVGLDSVPQLTEVLAAAAPISVVVPDGLSSDDVELVNPSNWA